VAALLEAATVWVVGEDEKRISQGSGFLVAAGFIATNAHVVGGLDKGADIYVLNDKLPATKAQVVAKAHDGDGGRDYALLRFTPPQGVDLPVLTFNLEARRMDRVSAWGYPAMVTQFDDRTARLQEGDTRGLKAPPVVYTDGSINSIVSRNGRQALIHSAQIAGGNSGGPLVNSRGEIVGINTWGYQEEGEGAFLNAALPADDLGAFLSAQGVKPQIASGQQAAASRPPATQVRPDKPETSRPPKWAGREPDQPEDSLPDKRESQGQKEDQERGRRRDVGSFTVEVPRGWSVVEEEEDSIMLGADDDSALVAIMVADSEGLSLRQASRQIAEELDGTQPASDDDGETYTFTFSENEVEFTALVGDMEDGRHVMLLLGGDTDNQGIVKILESLEDK
jgi:hypothetical protein